MDYTKEYVAGIIKNARKEQGLRQSELAEKAGISEKHLSKIETGKNYPALDNFFKIAEILKLSFKDFGIAESGIISERKNELQKIIHTSSEKELKLYLEIINTIRRYL